MTEHEASRTLVKSPPELWAECSDASALARHLEQFGEIHITKLEPETAVAWEGEHASGTVRLEPSGWGTRVILTARAARAAPAAAAEERVLATTIETDEPAPPDPLPPAAAVPEARAGLFARLMKRFRPAPPAPPPPEPVAQDAPEPVAQDAPEPVAQDAPEPLAQAAPEPLAQAAPEPVAEAAPEPAAPPTDGVGRGAWPDPGDVLSAALDSLGQAHRRPFSRA